MTAGESSRKDSVSQSVFWQLLDRVMIGGIGFAVGVVVARALGVEAMGRFATATALTSMIGALSALGIDTSLPRLLALNQHSPAELVGSAIHARRLGGFVAVLVTSLSAWLLFREDPLIVITATLLSLAWLFPGGETLELFWITSGRSRTYLPAKLIVSILSATLRLAAAAGTRTIWVLAACAPIIALANEVLQRRTFGNRRCGDALAVSRPALRALLERNLPIIVAGAAILAYQRLDQLMLYKITGSASAGVYAVAIQLYEVSLILVVVFTRAWGGRVSAAALQRPPDLRTLQTSLSFMTALGWIAALGFAVLAEPGVNLIFGQSFAPAAEPLRWLGLSTLCVGLGTISGVWLAACGLEKVVLQRTLAGLAANFGLNLLLIPKWGPSGAAIATVLSQTVTCLLADLMHPATRPLFSIKLKALTQPTFSLTRATERT